MVFYEITESAVKEGVGHPRDLSMPLVNAQQARRALDHLVGFNLSPLLWRKIGPSLSAGRVQSPALRLIVEREQEIEAFKSQEYWTVHLDSHKDKEKFTARLTQYRGEKVEQFTIVTERHQAEVVEAIAKAARGHGHRRAGGEEAKDALARGAIHHLDAAAGGGAQARHDGRSAPCAPHSSCTKGVDIGARHGRSDHLHAHRLDQPGGRSRARDPRLRGEAFQRDVSAQRPGRVSQQVQECAGGARGDPADFDLPHAG